MPPDTLPAPAPAPTVDGWILAAIRIALPAIALLYVARFVATVASVAS